MSAICIWIKVLTAIWHQIFQARDATIDVEVRNLDSLLDDMKELRGDFHKILTEAQHVAGHVELHQNLPKWGKRNVQQMTWPGEKVSEERFSTHS